MSEEPAYQRLARIQAHVLLYSQVAEGDLDPLPMDDVAFLNDRLQNAEQMLLAQQDSVTSAAKHWHKIGYDEGFARAQEDCPVCRLNDEEAGG